MRYLSTICDFHLQSARYPSETGMNRACTNFLWWSVRNFRQAYNVGTPNKNIGNDAEEVILRVKSSKTALRDLWHLIQSYDVRLNPGGRVQNKTNRCAHILVVRPATASRQCPAAYCFPLHMCLKNSWSPVKQPVNMFGLFRYALCASSLPVTRMISLHRLPWFGHIFSELFRYVTFVLFRWAGQVLEEAI